MMDLTKKALPNTVTVGGRAYSIYTDFRVWMRFEIAVSKLKFGEKIAFDVTDLRTKVYETDETQQDVQLTASKGEICHRGG